jgi:Outer membrane protein beta-barrel domain
MKMPLMGLLVAGMAVSSNAAAQQATAGRQVIVEVDATFGTTTRSFTDSSTPLIHAERGELTASYDVPRTTGFTAGALVRVWRQLSAGVSYGQSSRSTSAQINGSLPHPFFFSRHRQIEGAVPEVERKESTLALQLRGSFPVARRATLGVFGGPAWLSVTQGIIEQVNYSETFPYDTATYTSATARNATQTKLAFLVGADVTYFFSRRIGVGGGFKYSAATVELPSLDSDVLETKTGGFGISTGVRFRF